MYIAFLTFLSLVAFFLPPGLFRIAFIILLLIIASVPFLIPLFRSKNRRLFFINIFVLAILLFLLVLFFRTLRDALPPPQILQNKIVGYTHYYGYPFSLDAAIFFLLLFLPASVYLIAKLKK